MDQDEAQALLIAAGILTIARSGARKQADLNRLRLLVSFQMRSLGQQLRDEEITQAEWFAQMNALIAASHLAAGLIQTERDPSAAMEDEIQDEIDVQQSFLEKFNDEITAGTVSAGIIVSRSQQYGNAPTRTFFNLSLVQAREDGFDEYKSVLGAADHCKPSSRAGCPEEQARGFVPLGELTPIGARTCLSNCRCHYVFRNSETMEERRG